MLPPTERHVYEDHHLSLPWGLSTPGKDYHLSPLCGIIKPLRGLSPLTSLGDYHPPERIITSPAADWIITPVFREMRPAMHTINDLINAPPTLLDYIRLPFLIKALSLIHLGLNDHFLICMTRKLQSFLWH